MKCAGFKKVDIKYDAHQKRIDILKKKIVALKLSHIVVRDGSIVASHPCQIVVRGGSTSSPSILIIGSGETTIVGAPLSQVVNLVTPSIAMSKASYVDIETPGTITRDKIRRKTSRRLHQNNEDKHNLKKLADGAFITATRLWSEDKLRIIMKGRPHVTSLIIPKSCMEQV